MTKLDRRLMTQTLRQIGTAAGVEIVASPEDRPDFETLLDVPLATLAQNFRTDNGLRLFVLRKLEQGRARAVVQRIANIFEPRIEAK